MPKVVYILLILATSSTKCVRKCFFFKMNVKSKYAAFREWIKICQLIQIPNLYSILFCVEL